jgi:ubiquinone/menaquinone biosynthesis C-methylase UbiE
MDRTQWLAERRAAVEATYDAEAPTYDDNEYPSDAQREWIGRFLGLVTPGGIVLDAPCGTGKYFDMVVAAGLRVVGVDGSAGMLAQARARGLADRLEHAMLQELAFDGEFDGAMCVDAMENVPPEDWPLVLGNLRRAVRPGGHLYLTVEEVEESDIAEAFEALTRAGLPAVHGEIVEGDVAGYHYYPGRDRVIGWLADAGLEIVDEGFDWVEDWGYRHFLLRVSHRTPAR